MAKYYVDWEQVDVEDVSVLAEAVARYLSAEEYPDTKVIASILGIKQVEEEDNGKPV